MEVDVVDREVSIAVDEIDEALADTVDGRDVELHRAGARRNRPRAKIERAAERRLGVVDAEREGADDRALDRLHGARNVGRLRVHDDVHRALAVELDLARAVPRDRTEAHRFQHAAQRLRLRRGELDELEPVHAERVLRFGDRFAVEGGRHRGSWLLVRRTQRAVVAIIAYRAPTRVRAAAAIRARAPPPAAAGSSARPSRRGRRAAPAG